MTTKKATGVTAFPLSWPAGWKRAKVKRASPFTMTTLKALNLVMGEVKRMGGEAMVISSNVPLSSDGRMRLDREPVDAGVAVYFQKDGESVTFACDTYDTVRDNLRAIGGTIEAMRAVERYGAGEITGRVFSGFKALAAPTAEPKITGPWWILLNVSETAPIEVVEAAYKAMAARCHPDRGGTADAMQRINRARDEARAQIGARA